MIWLIVAGGVFAGGVMPTATLQDTELLNNTLLAEVLPAKHVVCRNLWGTPMLPDGKGGYSLIQSVKEEFINQSLIIPPYASKGMVAYRPLPPVSASQQ